MKARRTSPKPALAAVPDLSTEQLASRLETQELHLAAIGGAA
jgi:hypothetical protein